MVDSGTPPYLMRFSSIAILKSLEALRHHFKLEHTAIMETNDPKNESQEGNPILDADSEECGPVLYD